MADELLKLWDSLSLSEGEGMEVDIQANDVKGAFARGNSCIVGKLVTD